VKKVKKDVEELFQGTATVAGLRGEKEPEKSDEKKGKGKGKVGNEKVLKDVKAALAASKSPAEIHTIIKDQAKENDYPSLIDIITPFLFQRLTALPLPIAPKEETPVKKKKRMRKKQMKKRVMKKRINQKRKKKKTCLE